MYQRFILINYQTATLHREKPLLIHLIIFHREKQVIEEEMQTSVLKETWNSHFLTSEFHSGCKNSLHMHLLTVQEEWIETLYSCRITLFLCHVFCMSLSGKDMARGVLLPLAVPLNQKTGCKKPLSNTKASIFNEG